MRKKRSEKNSSAPCAETTLAATAPRVREPHRAGGRVRAHAVLPVAAALVASLVLAGCAGSPTQTAADSRDASASRAADGRNTAAPRAAIDERTVPEAVLAAHDRAVDLMRRGEVAAAAAELERITAAHPGLPGPHVNLAILHRRAGRNDDALAALETALSLDPNHPEANNELGIVLRERGEFDAAEAAYRRALDARPDYALALYNLGVLLDLYLQRPAEALECYEAYQLAADDPDARVARWIVDLRRRVPDGAPTARVGRGDAM